MVVSMITSQDEAQLKAIFAMIDSNRDGKISKDEVRAFAVMMGSTKPIKEQELNMVWALADTDKDGLISYNEVVDAANKYGDKQLPQSLLDQTIVQKVNFVF
jgi:Ca2+-binding EF-hand superfamily protein